MANEACVKREILEIERKAGQGIDVFEFRCGELVGCTLKGAPALARMDHQTRVNSLKWLVKKEKNYG